MGMTLPTIIYIVGFALLVLSTLSGDYESATQAMIFMSTGLILEKLDEINNKAP